MDWRRLRELDSETNWTVMNQFKSARHVIRKPSVGSSNLPVGSFDQGDPGDGGFSPERA
jgi:SH3-like domain-containing protein